MAVYSRLVASRNLRDRLLAVGQRITSQRDLIADILERARRPLTASEVLKRATQTDPSIGRATVFRTLQTFQEIGIVTHVTLSGNQSGYLLCAVADHHHHLICKVCDTVVDLEEADVAPFLAHIESKHRFQVDHASFDIYGICAHCQETVAEIPLAGTHTAIE